LSCTLQQPLGSWVPAQPPIRLAVVELCGALEEEDCTDEVGFTELEASRHLFEDLSK